jgi:hypothetical protein
LIFSLLNSIFWPGISVIVYCFLERSTKVYRSAYLVIDVYHSLSFLSFGFNSVVAAEPRVADALVSRLEAMRVVFASIDRLLNESDSISSSAASALGSESDAAFNCVTPERGLAALASTLLTDLLRLSVPAARSFVRDFRVSALLRLASRFAGLQSASLSGSESSTLATSSTLSKSVPSMSSSSTAVDWTQLEAVLALVVFAVQRRPAVASSSSSSHTETNVTQMTDGIDSANRTQSGELSAADLDLLLSMPRLIQTLNTAVSDNGYHSSASASTSHLHSSSSSSASTTHHQSAAVAHVWLLLLHFARIPAFRNSLARAIGIEEVFTLVQCMPLPALQKIGTQVCRRSSVNKIHHMHQICNIMDNIIISLTNICSFQTTG